MKRRLLINWRSVLPHAGRDSDLAAGAGRGSQRELSAAFVARLAVAMCATQAALNHMTKSIRDGIHDKPIPLQLSRAGGKPEHRSNQSPQNMSDHIVDRP